MFDPLSNYIDRRIGEFSVIPQDRREILDNIAEYIRDKRADGKPVQMLFICTHNSRRSHFCQIWMATAAHYYSQKQVHTFSGGTETTAFNLRAVQAISRAGFKMENGEGENPRYRIRYDEVAEPIACYSKIFDDPTNPQKGFAAIMTCSEADENCPVVPGADLRVSCPYRDPKQADDTPEESKIYDKRCQQIAREMLYCCSRV